MTRLSKIFLLSFLFIILILILLYSLNGIGEISYVSFELSTFNPTPNDPSNAVPSVKVTFHNKK